MNRLDYSREIYENHKQLIDGMELADFRFEPFSRIPDPIVFRNISEGFPMSFYTWDEVGSWLRVWGCNYENQ